jgi:hypothetical protein
MNFATPKGGPIASAAWNPISSLAGPDEIDRDMLCNLAVFRDQHANSGLISLSADIAIIQEGQTFVGSGFGRAAASIPLRTARPTPAT